LASVNYDIENFQKPLVDTLQDSTVSLRSIAYYVAKGNYRLADAFQKALKNHPLFDHSFVLTANKAKRIERLNERIKATPHLVSDLDSAIITNPDEFFLMEKILIDTAKTIFQSKIIDTSDLTKDEVVQKITNNII
jgi:hypothetical protein